jgi:hypothetical protein
VLDFDEDDAVDESFLLPHAAADSTRAKPTAVRAAVVRCGNLMETCSSRRERTCSQCAPVNPPHRCYHIIDGAGGANGKHVDGTSPNFSHPDREVTGV